MNSMSLEGSKIIDGREGLKSSAVLIGLLTGERERGGEGERERERER